MFFLHPLGFFLLFVLLLCSGCFFLSSSFPVRFLSWGFFWNFFFSFVFVVFLVFSFLLGFFVLPSVGFLGSYDFLFSCLSGLLSLKFFFLLAVVFAFCSFFVVSFSSFFFAFFFSIVGFLVF